MRTSYKRCDKCEKIVEMNTPCPNSGSHRRKIQLGSGYPYEDSVLGTTVTSRGHKNKLMKQHGLIEKA